MVSMLASPLEEEWQETHVSPGDIEEPSLECDVTPLVQTTTMPPSPPPVAPPLLEPLLEPPSGLTPPPELPPLLELVEPPELPELPPPSPPPPVPESVADEPLEEPPLCWPYGPASPKSPQVCTGAPHPATTSPPTSTQFGSFVMPSRCRHGPASRQAMSEIEARRRT